MFAFIVVDAMVTLFYGCQFGISEFDRKLTFVDAETG
jgi:hypothetical protein